MIRGFRDRDTERLFRRQRPRRLPASLHRSALRKLAMLNRAENLGDLRVPPNNKLEPLKRDRVGQWSIRINDQWRLCFRFVNGDAFDVAIVDYH